MNFLVEWAGGSSFSDVEEARTVDVAGLSWLDHPWRCSGEPSGVEGN
jgi:hypothetical protein